MKTSAKVATACLCVALVAAIPAFAACSSQQTYVTSIAKTGTDGTTDTYTVYYSDGSSSTFSVNNEADSLTASDLYEEYKAQTGEDITFAEFLEKYLTVNADSTALATNECLLSTMKIYAQFVETRMGMMYGRPYYVSDYNIYSGAAVIYDMDESEGGYTYIVTNYHVIYDSDADVSLNGGNLPASIHGYLYGSEGTFSDTGTDDEYGYTLYDYGDYAIDLEYVGGSVDNDIAVLRAKTEDIKKINPDAKEVTIGDGYYVGETAFTVGNPDDYGMSVTRGIISTVDEQIALNIDGTTRYYRSMRIDTAIYSGNSGGGLFNSSGELIGIANAGAGEEQNINYAVPLEIVTGVVNNIIYYANDSDDDTVGGYDVSFGMTYSATGSHYVLDVSSGYGSVVEDINVATVGGNSIANAIGVQQGDVLTAIVINGNETALERTYDIDDASLTLRPGDVVNFKVSRDGEEVTLNGYTLASTDFDSIDD